MSLMFFFFLRGHFIQTPWKYGHYGLSPWCPYFTSHNLLLQKINMHYRPRVRSSWLGYWPSSFMCFHLSQSIKMQRTRTLFSHLDHTSLVSKGFNIWPKSELFIVGPMQDLGSQSECRIHFILPACGFSHKL